MTNDLIHLGLIDEDEIVLDEAALQLALVDHADMDIRPYEDVLEAIARRLVAIAADVATARQQATALAQVLADEFGFAGDAETYDDPANVDLMQVIDRRRGLPVSIAILYVAAARCLGWSANVLPTDRRLSPSPTENGTRASDGRWNGDRRGSGDHPLGFRSPGFRRVADAR